jgi:hypothetical protein
MGKTGCQHYKLSDQRIREKLTVRAENSVRNELSQYPSFSGGGLQKARAAGMLGAYSKTGVGSGEPTYFAGVRTGS